MLARYSFAALHLGYTCFIFIKPVLFLKYNNTSKKLRKIRKDEMNGNDVYFYFILILVFRRKEFSVCR